MKNILYLIAASVLLVQFSCGPNVRFEVPQPAGVKQEKKFSAKYQGEYIAQDNKSRLVITKTNITHEFIPLKFSLQVIDTTEGMTFEKENGRLYVDGDTLIAELEGDSVKAFWGEEVTFFEISEEQVLKKYKGSYFLNTKESDGTWSVQVISIDKSGLLTFSAFEGGEENLPEIEEVTPVTISEGEDGEVLNYVVNPSKKELKEMMNSNLLQIDDRMLVLGGDFQKVK